MFNSKKFKASQVSPTEKYLRNEDKAKPADDNQPIAEKMLPDRKGDEYKVTEGQRKEKSDHQMKNKEGDNGKDVQIIKSILNEAKCSYFVQRI